MAGFIPPDSALLPAGAEIIDYWRARPGEVIPVDRMERVIPVGDYLVRIRFPKKRRRLRWPRRA